MTWDADRLACTNPAHPGYGGWCPICHTDDTPPHQPDRLRRPAAMPEITNPAPAPFPYTTIATDSGQLTIPCEPINEWIAITPVLGMDKDGNAFLGTFTITHRPTGSTLGDGDACINCCRASGRKFASLPSADWSALTADNAAEWLASLTEEDRQTFHLYRALEWGCDAEYCEVPAEQTPITTVHLPAADIPA